MGEAKTLTSNGARLGKVGRCVLYAPIVCEVKEMDSSLLGCVQSNSCCISQWRCYGIVSLAVQEQAAPLLSAGETTKLLFF